MTFIKGSNVELRVLPENDYEVTTWTNAVMAGLTTQHLFTGSYPMRYIDVKEQWKKEREAGDILFGIWLPRSPEDKDTRAPAYIAPPTGYDDYSVFIGTCGLHQHREVYQSAEARFLIFDAEAVGKGIGKEVSRLLTEYAFKRLNLHRLWLGVSADNLRAVKCYLDTGFIVEGCQRDELYYGGTRHHTYRMALLRDEWEAGRGKG